MLLVALTPPRYAADMSRFEKRMLTITILVSCALRRGAGMDRRVRSATGVEHGPTISVDIGMFLPHQLHARW